MKKQISRLVAVTMLMSSALMVSAGGIEPKQDTKKMKWGYVDPSTDKWVVKPKYDSAEPLSEQPNGKMRARVTSDGKTGFLDENGKTLNAGVVFEEITPLQGDAMFVTVKGKKGVANYDGAYLIKPELTAVEPLEEEGYFILKNNKTGFIKPDGTLLLDMIYEKIDPSIDGYFIVYKGGKAGITLRDGEMKLAPKDFTDAQPFGKYWLVSKKDKKGLYDLQNGKLLIEPKFDEFSEPFVIDKEYVSVRDKNKWGVYSTAGERLLKCKSIEIVPLPAERAIYSQTGEKKGKLYYVPSMKNIPTKFILEKKMGPFVRTEIETKDNFIISFTDKYGKSIKNGAFAEKRDRFYFVGKRIANTDTYNHDLYDEEGEFLAANITLPGNYYGEWVVFGNQAVSPQNEVYDCKLLNNGQILFVKTQGGQPWRILDKAGNFSGAFENVGGTCHRNAWQVKNNGLWGVYDGNEMLVDYISDEPIQYLGDGVYSFTKNGLKGAVTTEGVVLPAEYQSLAFENNSSDILRARKDDFKGKFNVKENKWTEQVTGQFYKLSDFSDYYRQEEGHIVLKNYKAGFLDENGLLKVPVEYDKIESVPTGFIVTNDRKTGVLDKNGQIKLPVEYDEIRNVGDVYAAVKGNSTTYYDEKTFKVVTRQPSFEVTEASAHRAIGWEIEYSFCPNKTYTLKVKITNKKTGKLVHSFDYKLMTSRTGFGSDRNSWFLSNMPKRVNLVARCTLYDSNGKQVTLKNNRELVFYIE